MLRTGRLRPFFRDGLFNLGDDGIGRGHPNRIGGQLKQWPNAGHQPQRGDEVQRNRDAPNDGIAIVPWRVELAEQSGDGLVFRHFAFLLQSNNHHRIVTVVVSWGTPFEKYPMIFNLHAVQPQSTQPHDFEQMPKSVFLVIRLPSTSTPQEIEARFVHFVNLETLSPMLAQQVRNELTGGIVPAKPPQEPTPQKNLQIHTLAPGQIGVHAFVVGHVDDKADSNIKWRKQELEDMIREIGGVELGGPPTQKPETKQYSDVNAFLNAMMNCRDSGGDIEGCDDPWLRCIGFIHSPPQGGSTVHQIGLREIRSSNIKEETAARFSLTLDEIKDRLSTVEGRHFLATGSMLLFDSEVSGQDEDGFFKLEPGPVAYTVSPTGDAEFFDENKRPTPPLHMPMLFDPVVCNVLPNGEVEFPDIQLDLIAPLRTPFPALKPWRGPRSRHVAARPTWAPSGWLGFTLPDDRAQFALVNEKGAAVDAPDASTKGAFTYRGSYMSRVFEDGRWDLSRQATPDSVETNVATPARYIYLSSGFQTNVADALREATIALHNTIKEQDIGKK
jgi:hypothetical protein